MTARALTPEQIRHAAQIAAETKTVIEIRSGERLYTIRPAQQDEGQDLDLELRSMKR